MSNTEKRNQRINLVLSPSIKSGLTKIAAIKQISINELANQTFEKLILDYQKKIDLYDQFIQQISSHDTISKMTPFLKNRFLLKNLILVSFLPMPIVNL